MQDDPKQFTNLAADPSYADVLVEQRKRLESRLRAADLSRG